MTPVLEVTEFTDPGCPYAWSAEPARRRLDWLYGDGLGWSLRMVGLAADPSVYVEHGFTPERQADAHGRLAERHGMPIDTAPRARMHATLPACRAIVGVRRHAPQRERAFLRAVRIEFFSGALLDERETIAAAARRCGLDPGAVEAWTAEEETDALLQADLETARTPTPEALALPDKLARAGEDGWRYTCPSLVFRRPGDGGYLDVPGFQPLAAYEIAVANLAPSLPRRAAPQSVEEVLEWAGEEPLASAEVAAVCDISLRDAREQLGRTAVEEHVGADGLWTIR